MGRISAPFGIKGWIRLQAYSGSPDSLMDYATWWLDGATGWQAYTVQQAQVQGPDVLAKLAGCDDRDAAAALKGTVVAVPRDAFPPTGQGEFYWADLVGLRVVNLAGEDFGVVRSMLETGANAVMVVQQAAAHAGEQERLIPFIADVIRRVDIGSGLIEVDWGADY